MYIGRKQLYHQRHGLGMGDERVQGRILHHALAQLQIHRVGIVEKAGHQAVTGLGQQRHLAGIESLGDDEKAIGVHGAALCSTQRYEIHSSFLPDRFYAHIIPLRRCRTQFPQALKKPPSYALRPEAMSTRAHWSNCTPIYRFIECLFRENTCP